MNIFSKIFALSVGLASVAHAAEIGDQAESILINNRGETIGTVLYTQGSGGVLLNISVKGLPAGKHGMHFHNKGTCEDTEHFKSAKGHIMPDQKPHGLLNPDGPHAGNLPNLIVRQDGAAEIELFTHLVTLDDGENALLDADGSTLILHAEPDDHISQPIGGSGGRIACGVITAK
ncbi:MAG: superoxide dismutase family protein [Pseudomonadota bacterium]